MEKVARWTVPDVWVPDLFAYLTKHGIMEMPRRGGATCFFATVASFKLQNAPCKHYSSSRLGNGGRSLQGAFCMPPKKIADDYRTLAARKGMEWIGSLPADTSGYSAWRGTCGHIDQMTYTQVRLGRHLCKDCSYRERVKCRKLDASNYHRVARRHKLKWLGQVIPTVDEPTPWLCSKGHVWHATYSNVKQGVRCLYCSHKRPKTELDYQEMARMRNIEWLGPLPKNVASKTWWKCQKGHRWKMTYHALDNDQGCPQCGKLSAAAKLRKNEEDYVDLAQRLGLEWIGKKLPAGVVAKTRWRCQKGHEFITSYHNLDQGTGCPKCARQRISESMRGENNVNWRGGPTKYPTEFTERLKRKIRKRDEYRCAICGKNWRWGTLRYSVHHVDFNPDHCKPSNLITLCISCHMWTNGNRDKAIVELSWLMSEREKHAGYGIALRDFDPAWDDPTSIVS